MIQTIIMINRKIFSASQLTRVTGNETIWITIDYNEAIKENSLVWMDERQWVVRETHLSSWKKEKLEIMLECISIIDISQIVILGSYKEEASPKL